MKFENRKDEILKVAAKLFKEKGYSAVTMRDLAQEMGIKAASLYNHISSKQELLSDIIITIAEAFTNQMDIIKNANISNVEKLKKIIMLHIKITTQNTSEMASLNSDWMHLEEQLDYYLSLRKTYENNFRNILIAGIEANEIKDVNTDILLFSLLSTLRSLYLWIPKKEDLDTELLSVNLQKVLIEGIKK